MNATVERCLDALEARIDDAVERDLMRQWEQFWEGQWPEPIFTARRKQAAANGFEWPKVLVNEALDDLDKMVLQQYLPCLRAVTSGSGMAMNVRANYGVGILPTLFGAELFLMADEQDCLPNVWPVGEARLLALLDHGVPDLESGLGGKVLEAGARFREIATRYPAIGRHVFIYHPDLQGPMDVCELLWGSEVFVALIDKAELVHEVLELVTETYIAFMERWDQVVPPAAGLTCHWGMVMKGRLCIRDDSAMNLSPDAFDAFIAPYNQRLLDRFGGGIDHFCGHGDHFIARLSALDGLYGINVSQPHLNAMDVIFDATVDRGVHLCGLQRQAADAAVAAGRELRGMVHCW